MTPTNALSCEKEARNVQVDELLEHTISRAITS